MFAVCAGYVGADPSQVRSSSSDAVAGAFKQPRRSTSQAADDEADSVAPETTSTTAAVTRVKCLLNPFANLTTTATTPEAVEHFEAASELMEPQAPRAAPMDDDALAEDELVSAAAGDAAAHGGGGGGVGKSSDCSELIGILNDACLLLRRCCPRTRLPVACAEALVRCPLPKGEAAAEWSCLLEQSSFYIGTWSMHACHVRSVHALFHR